MARVSHPPREELAAFVQGKLSAADTASVEEHLLGCDSCVASLAAQPEDALLRLARQQAPLAGAAVPPTSEFATNPAYETPTVVLPTPTAQEPPPCLGAGAGAQVPALLAEHERYRVVRLLGQGGMGAIYLAEHRVMRRLVALKVIKHIYTADRDAVERFRREVRAAAQLHHPNIVTAHDADQIGDTHFLVMEYVEGISLSRLVQECGPLPVAPACLYVRQAAVALQHAHERGLVHRDVKPDNLMLTGDGTVKVLDFGLAALAAERGASPLTSENVVMGTPDYMAPEQAEDARAADTRADVYSLGCTLYFLLTGQAPYPAPTALAKILAHRERPLPHARDLRPEVPPGLDAVLGRMLAKSPADRYQTPGEVAAALAPYIAAAGVPVEEPVAPGPAPTAAGGTARRTRLAVAVAALLAVLGVAGYLARHALLGGVSGEGEPERQGAGAAVGAGADGPALRAVSWASERTRGLFADRAHALGDVLDFRDLAGAGAEELSAWHSALGPEFRLARVTSRRGRGTALFNAVAVREKTPHLVRFRPAVPWPEIDRNFNDLRADGFRLVSLCYPPPDQNDPWVEGQVWVQDGIGFYVTGGSLPSLMALLDKKKSEGLRPIVLEWGVHPREGTYYVVSLAEVKTRPWEVFYNLSADELLATVQAFRDKRWRPDVVAPHWQDGQLRFLLVVVDNGDQVDWRLRLDMSLEQYREESVKQKAGGQFPLALCSYGDGDGARYAALWVRHRAPGVPAPALPVPSPQALADQGAKAASWTGAKPRTFFADPAHSLKDVLDFREIAGASVKELREWADGLGPAFHVASVTNRRGSGPPLFNAVAVREKNPLPFRFFPEVGKQQIDEIWKRQYAEGYRPVNICCYLPAGQQGPWTCALLWVKDGTTPYNFFGARDFIMETAAKVKGEHCRLAFLDGLMTSEGPTYRLIQPDDEGRSWEVLYTLGPEELVPAVAYYQRKGWRPDVLAPHWEDGRLRFMLVAVDNSDRVDWRFRMDMRLEDYRRESAEQKRRGLFPLALASYGDEAAVRYAAIWVRYRRPGGTTEK